MGGGGEVGAAGIGRVFVSGIGRDGGLVGRGGVGGADGFPVIGLPSRLGGNASTRVRLLAVVGLQRCRRRCSVKTFNYLLGFGGGEDAGLLATCFCDLSTTTLAVDGFDGVSGMLYLFGLGGGGVPGAAARGCCDPCTRTSPRGRGTDLGFGGRVGFFAMLSASV